MEFLYELHCHTAPVSACARCTPEEILSYYKSRGFDGVFVTNHFIDGNMCHEMLDRSYEEKINYYFDGFEQAASLSDKIGIKVFCGIETSYFGMDALVYGLGREWFLSHPETIGMTRRDQLQFFRDNGALVVQAHPFRQARYIDRIQLFVESVDAFETVNANNTDEQNRLADVVASSYGLTKVYGSDFHGFEWQKRLAGVKFAHPINSVGDLIQSIKKCKHTNFILKV